MAAGTRLGKETAAQASYSHLSANPDALVAQGGGAAPCLDCANSYGVAVGLRAHREDRMNDDAFRELGAVDIDPPALADAAVGYRYGGRFPDAEPTAVTSVDPRADIMGSDPSPDGTTAAPTPAEY